LSGHFGEHQQRLDERIGLEGPNEQIAVWRTEIQIDQLLAAQGEETSSTNEDHMVLEGPPDTAKTSFARIVAEILFGLGRIQRPDVMEITEEDLIVGYVSQTAQRMIEVCEEALGGVLFIDEAYPLVPEHEGHSFGKDAINTLLNYMEDFRHQLVVIVAGHANLALRASITRAHRVWSAEVPCTGTRGGPCPRRSPCHLAR
jgi:ESX secretion system protein EccA